MTYPTPEEIKQIASDCCFAYSRRGDGVIECPSDEELQAFATRMIETGRKMPNEILFDGYAVFQALDKKASTRTSAENVSDVLDAAVRLIRNNTGE